MTKRNDIFKKSVSRSLIAKVASIILSLINLRVTLSYLDVESYGIWITIFSITSWIVYFDLGLGNGLRNKLTEAVHQNDGLKAKRIITTSYVTLSIIGVFLFVLISLAISFFNIENFLNLNNVSNLKIVILIVVLFTVINFILSLYKQLNNALYKTEYNEISILVFQSLCLVTVIILDWCFSPSLLLLAIGFGFSQTFVSLIFTYIFFSRNRDFIPNLKEYSNKINKDILSQGSMFFLIQISMMIIFTTDNVIITKYLGPESVTTYSITFNLYQKALIVSSIALTPIWALYKNAILDNDINWIINTIKKSNFIFFLFSLLIIIGSFFTKDIIKLWLGRDLSYPDYLIQFCAIFIMIRVFSDIYMYYLNAAGVIKLQMYLYVFGAIMNIPLSIWLIKNTTLGSSGVILATIITMLPFVILMPVKVYLNICKLRDDG